MLDGGGNDDQSSRRLSAEEKAELVKIAQVRFDEDMAPHTTLSVGGPADAFVEIANEAELKAVLAFAETKKIPYFILGSGSNVLVRDGGIRGLVLCLKADFAGCQIVEERDADVFVQAGSALGTMKFLRWCNDQGLTGHEVLTGVPGCIGGNIATNAGTHVGQLSDVVEEVRVMSAEGKISTLRKKALHFDYRQCKLPKGCVILSALFRLQRVAAEEAGKKFRELMERRKATQPIQEQSSGCMFKNAGKISAGKLIDEAGLKGIRVGKARISDAHANFIVNEGGAKAKDVLILMGLIKERVKQNAHVVLEQEVIVVGEDENAKDSK